MILVRCECCSAVVIVVTENTPGEFEQLGPVWCEGCSTDAVGLPGQIEKLRQRVHELEQNSGQSRRLERMEHRVNGFERELRAKVPELKRVVEQRVEVIEDAHSKLLGKLNAYVKKGIWK